MSTKVGQSLTEGRGVPRSQIAIDTGAFVLRARATGGLHTQDAAGRSGTNAWNAMDCWRRVASPQVVRSPQNTAAGLSSSPGGRDGLLPTSVTDTPEAARSLIPRSSRQERDRRTAIARRKLDALRERERLRALLSDVWDEPAGT